MGVGPDQSITKGPNQVDTIRVLLVEPSIRVALIHEDPQDNMFLECAIAAHAGFIISGDRHLRKITAFRGIPIVSPREYLRLAQSPHGG